MCGHARLGKYFMAATTHYPPERAGLDMLGGGKVTRYFFLAWGAHLATLMRLSTKVFVVFSLCRLALLTPPFAAGVIPRAAGRICAARHPWRTGGPRSRAFARASPDRHGIRSVRKMGRPLNGLLACSLL